MSGFSKPPCVVSADFLRVKGLPVRTDDSYPPNLTDEMTRLLKRPDVDFDAHGNPLRLKDVQARALYDLGTHGKGFFPLRVGAGKTLISFLAPRVLEAKRPLLVVPGGLLKKTEREWHEMAKYWRVAKHLDIKSYDFLSRVSGAAYLDREQKDMILADEAHKLKNLRAAVTRRFRRYIEGRIARDEKIVFVPLTGTPMKKSIKNFAHLLEWSHREAAPTPLYAATLMEWSEALDESINPFSMRPPGALLDLMPGATDDSEMFEDDRHRARVIFQKRMLATSGIIISDAVQDYGGSLQINAIEYTPNEVTEANFQKLRDTSCRPDGWALTEAVQVWACARQLALGMHYIWEPAAPQEWLDKRRQWASFVRETLKAPSSSRAGIDSELQVTNAVDRGEIEDEYDLLGEWRKIAPTFDVNSKEVWHDDTALNVCAEWLKTHPKGICWVEHILFGRELSRRTGLPFFGAGGVTGRKGSVLPFDMDPDVSGPVIASHANLTGRNLQFKWCDNLITAPRGDSEFFEQLIGRTHRDGQSEDEVTVDILVGCREHLESIPRALNSSDVKQSLLGFTQKLRLADIDDWPDDTQRRPGKRWAA